MTGVQNSFIIDRGGIIWKRGDSFSKIMDWGKPPGHISPGHLDRVYIMKKLINRIIERQLKVCKC